jgi:hypothetical protein
MLRISLFQPLNLKHSFASEITLPPATRRTTRQTRGTLAPTDARAHSASRGGEQETPRLHDADKPLTIDVVHVLVAGALALRHLVKWYGPRAALMDGPLSVAVPT